MNEIKQTNNYSIFKFIDSNRNIDQGHVNFLCESIKKNNLLKYRPIDVNEKFEIIEGQHRLLAAKRLNVDIFYKVIPGLKKSDMITFNSGTKNWTVEDYIKYYACEGVQSYEDLQELMQKWNLSASAIISLNGLGERNLNKIKIGEFKFSKEDVFDSYDFYRQYCDVIKKYRPSSERLFLRNRQFIKALSAFIKLPGVEKDVLIEKTILKMNYLRPCTNTKDYLNILSEMYNYRNRKPVEMTFDKNGKLDQWDYES